MIKVLLIFGKHAQLIESCIMSLALTLMQLAYFLLAASFRHLLACLGAWISRHGLSWSMVWPVFELHDEQLLLRSFKHTLKVGMAIIMGVVLYSFMLKVFPPSANPEIQGGSMGGIPPKPSGPNIALYPGLLGLVHTVLACAN